MAVKPIQETTFTTAHVMDNEIIKASDFEFAFEQMIENISKATTMLLESNQDFVINGKVLPDNAMNVKVSPIYGVCKYNGKPFGRTDESESIAIASTTVGRIDILEVKGGGYDENGNLDDYTLYDEQQRAFNDPDTDTQTYEYVKTKKLMQPVYRVVQGEEGSGVAPDVEEGWVKLAEIEVGANATEITEEDIHNITADVAGMDNENWTNQKDITYNIGYISDVNARFRVQHNEDGTHAENSIDKFALDMGTGANQVNGNVMPIGGTVTIPTQTVAATDSILSVISKAVILITSLYNNYLKFGTYGFNGELSVSSLLNDGTTTLKKPITLSADGSGNAVIKVDGTAIITIDSNGHPKISTAGYTPTASNDIVTKAITDALNTSLSNLANRVTTLEHTVQSQSANKVLSTGTGGQFNISNVLIVCATTENIVLNGTSTPSVDGYTLTNDELILVKDQTDPKENGVYKFVSNSGWDRANEFDVPSKLKGQILQVKNGIVNKGKMFYMLNEVVPESFGNDNVYIAEYFGSISPLGNRLVMRDANGRAKVAAPVESDDIARKAEIDGICSYINSLYSDAIACPLGTASAGTATTFARSDHVHPLPARISYEDTLLCGFAEITNVTYNQLSGVGEVRLSGCVKTKADNVYRGATLLVGYADYADCTNCARCANFATCANVLKISNMFCIWQCICSGDSHCQCIYLCNRCSFPGFVVLTTSQWMNCCCAQCLGPYMYLQIGCKANISFAKTIGTYTKWCTSGIRLY
jgi:hypothetical protein